MTEGAVFFRREGDVITWEGSLQACIELAIEAGHFDSAALLAAKLEHPRDHRDAMIRIHNARPRATLTGDMHNMHKPQFELTSQEVLLNTYTPRRELRGEDRVPAASLTFTANLDAGALAMLHPTLRSAFFFKDANNPGDMIDQVADAADLRFPEVGKPIAWTKEIVGAEIEIDHGLGGKSNIKLPTCDVDNFTFDPQQGGQVIFTFRVACHPDQKQSGQLAFLIGETVKLTLRPPEADLVEKAAA